MARQLALEEQVQELNQQVIKLRSELAAKSAVPFAVKFSGFSNQG
jgi:hypothetical protein